MQLPRKKTLVTSAYFVRWAAQGIVDPVARLRTGDHFWFSHPCGGKRAPEKQGRQQKRR